MKILWILLPGTVVGALLADSVRKIFSEDDRLLWNLFRSQPVTMLAATTTVGSVLVWAVLEVLQVW